MTSLDRNQPPGPSETTRDFRFPDFTYQSVDDHLEIYAARWGRAPLVSLELILPGGGQSTPLDVPGLASFTAALLDEGSERWTGPEIAEQIERLGGSLGSGADWDTASVSAICLAKDSETALDLISDIALRPTFPQEAVEREGARRLAEMRRRHAQPSYLADRCLQSTIYRGTTYAEPLIGTADGLVASDRSRLQRFFDQGMKGPIQLIAVGNLDPTTLIGSARERLGGLTRQSVSEAPSIEPPTPPQAPRVLIVDRPGGSQTELRLGHVGVPRCYPDRTTLAVMSSLLGGKFTSRINLNLRERNGYTYGARAAFSARRGPGPFTISAAVETPSAGAAAREVIAELTRIRAQPVEKAELDDTVGYLLGVFPYTLQAADGVAATLAHLAVHRLPHDYYHRLQERLESVTVESVHKVALDTLSPDSLTIVAVGPAEELESQFGEIGPVELVQI